MGNIGRDAQGRFTPGGDRAVANFSVATSEFRGGGGGERQSNAVYAGLSSQPESCSLADQQAWLLAWMKL